MATTLAQLTAGIACHSNSASPSNLSSQVSPNLMRFGLRSSFPFSCVLAKQSTGQVVSALHQQHDSFVSSDNYGGKYDPETLMSTLSELESAFRALHTDHEFQKELDGILGYYVCREAPLYFAERLTEYYKRPNGEGPKIYFKRQDCDSPYLHKMKNAIGQALLAKRLGKKRIIAEVGAGEDGVATANACKHFGLQCIIYIADQDIERQAIDLNRMKLWGAEVRRVDSDAKLEAIRDWITNLETTHYIIGSVAGPHPYPMMVREFQSVIGKETRKLAMEEWGGKPDVIVSFVGGVSNAMGLFNEFVEDKEVSLIGVEALGFVLNIGKQANTFSLGEEVGVRPMTYLLQDDGQSIDILSIIDRLNLSGVGPEHNSLKDSGRAEFYRISDKQALEAYYRVPRFEGVRPSLEASHALAYLEKLCPTLANGTKVVINFNARGENEPRLL